MIEGCEVLCKLDWVWANQGTLIFFQSPKVSLLLFLLCEHCIHIRYLWHQFHARHYSIDTILSITKSTNLIKNVKIICGFNINLWIQCSPVEVIFLKYLFKRRIVNRLHYIQNVKGHNTKITPIILILL